MRDTQLLRARLLFHILVVAGTAACGKSPSRDRMPSCPSGEWCTTVATAAGVAAPDAGTELGCSKSLQWSQGQGDAGDDPQLPGRWGYAGLNVTTTTATRGKGSADACCYHWSQPCPGGRPLLAEEGDVVLARLGAAAGWRDDLSPAVVDDLDPATREAVADAWTADALAEHASVASFARAALELLAVGAPADLVAGCQRASLDEIEHARACFAIASRFARAPRAPGPLASPPPREATLARLAVDTFVEGCVGETIAALAAERARSRCPDAAIAAALERIARDEASHAELAWRTVAWAVRTGGAEVLDAIEARARARRTAGAGDRDLLDPATLARCGRLPRAEALAVEAEAWRDVIAPALALLARRRGSPRESARIVGVDEPGTLA